MNLGPHADFIIASYAVTVFVIGSLIAARWRSSQPMAATGAARSFR